MAHFCVKECPKGLRGHGFPSEASLAQHRRNCEHWNAFIARPRPATSGHSLSHSSTSSSCSCSRPSKKPRLQLPQCNTEQQEDRDSNNSASGLGAFSAPIPSPSLGFVPLNVHNDDSEQSLLRHIADLDNFEQPSPALQSPPAAGPSEPDPYPPSMVTTSGRASCLPRCFGDEPPQAAPALVHPVDEPTAPSQNRRVTLIV
ncbi:hypothetical protein BT96DRAFT_1003963 [Gymnopus androsaceus JB14]|uniref:Uncharacterized protein n=1 Tax=Gymnopus androsaceus JB14 TaxID=1447944 RepID=A0A6A4GTM8_9AGAR|nr:hypothetical protein BT96DRAFT_1003963 [Gymnopus androsaceus JB14]